MNNSGGKQPGESSSDNADSQAPQRPMAVNAPQSSDMLVPLASNPNFHDFLGNFPRNFPRNFHPIDEIKIPPNGIPTPSLANVALEKIRTPHPNDVLCGRGGGTNNHIGNERFRVLVNQQKLRYLNSSKRDKPLVSRGIVRAVRCQNPPGRFLQKDEKTGFYYDIGDGRAREKTSQALREGAPDIRKEINYIGTSQSSIPFPESVLAGGVTSLPAHPMAAALLSAATAYNQESRPGAVPKPQGTNDFSNEIERHIRNACQAEALIAQNEATIEQNARSSAPGTSLSLEQPRKMNGDALAARHTTTLSGDNPTKQGNGHVVSSSALAFTDSKSTSSPHLQPQQQQQSITDRNGSMTQFQQAFAASAATGLPFPSMSQRHQMPLSTGPAQPNFSSMSFPGTSNAATSMSTSSSATRLIPSTLGAPVASIAPSSTVAGKRPSAFGTPLASMPSSSGAFGVMNPAAFMRGSTVPPNHFMTFLPGVGLPNVSSFPGGKMRSSISGFGTPAASAPNATSCSGLSATGFGQIAAPNSTSFPWNSNLGGNSSSGLVMGGKSPAPIIMANPVTARFRSQQQHRHQKLQLEQQLEQQQQPNPSGSIPPSLTQDMIFRLVFAEMISQKTANGTLGADISAAEDNINYHLDAGLLAIDPSAMAEHLVNGYSEKDIVQHYRELAAEAAVEQHAKEENRKFTKDNGDDGKGRYGKEGDNNGVRNDVCSQDKSGDNPDGDNARSSVAQGGASEQHTDNGDEIGEKRPFASNDGDKSLKRAKYEVWAPPPSRRLQNPIERRVVDALICIGAIERT